MSAAGSETHRDAVAFNRGLPCRADVTDVEEEGTPRSPPFELREGPPATAGKAGAR